MFDGERVNKLLESSKDNTFTSYYTDEEGKRTKLFELVKKYKLGKETWYRDLPILINKYEFD